MKLRNKIRLLFAFVLCIALILPLFCFSVSASETVPYDFANFTEDNSQEFVERYGVDIPETLLQSGNAYTVAQELILTVYNNPTVSFSYDDLEMQYYAEDIRALVRSFMGRGLIFPNNKADYCLQHSKVMNEAGEWVTSEGDYNEQWDGYNCYAYAIHRAESPAFYSETKQYRPGVMSGVSEWWAGNPDVYQLAVIIENDLIAMGYNNVTRSTNIPTIDESQELICVRMGAGDYHFMRYDLETDAWYHKPGDSAVLRYNYKPRNDLPWYIEASEDGHESAYTEEDEVYDSDIIFITYSKNQINVGSTEATSSVSIQPGKDVFCELNFAQSGFYTITITSTNRFTFDLYNEDFEDYDEYDEDNSLMSDCASITLSINIDAENGKYYLRMNFIPNVPTPSNPTPAPMPTEPCAITVSIAPYTMNND